MSLLRLEAYSTIVVTIENKTVAKAKVSRRGTFDVKLPKQSKGTKTIALYAIDKAGNKSHSVKRTIKVK